MAPPMGMNFDGLARHYDWMETVSAGTLLQRARTCFLDGLSDRNRVLSVGEGHGKFAGAFIRRFPSAYLTCVDASAPMLERARQRARSSRSPVRWIHAELPDWTPPAASFDAVVTCFFLDCFRPDQLHHLIAALAASTTRNAVWLVVDFALPEHGVARWRAQAIHAAMYGFFRAAVQLPAHRLTPPDGLLRSHGFRLEGRREFSCGLLRADLWRR